ncbi:MULTISPECIES: hypothetical protein [unclassified Francisella]|uniref:hypothetical protein n=1 Tax=unclassified Francisella TaxID=2610885 RepID=UPI002E338118|nr:MULTISPECIES: hypothetical protein [unclassified Francisella]MED7818847.1 hypothetical protein [Francisella sp. 19S2-4]MED7829698.1 hypothetical protein [Francisella sp. 19S2-10]
MKLERVLFFILLISIFSLCYAYIVNDNGKNINVTNKQANLIDDIEMQEGEALSKEQILSIIGLNSGSSLK